MGLSRAQPFHFFPFAIMKKLRYALALLALLASSWLPASAQVFEWAKLARNLGRPDGYSQAASTDLAGNTYTSVRFRDSIRVGGVRLTATGAADVLVKYDSTGRVAWTKVMRGVTFENGGLKVNPATGDLFMLGRALPGATWDGSPVLPGGTSAYFYGKCSPTGALLWARTRPFLSIVSFEADSQGNCYFIGRGNGTVGGISADSTSLVLVQAGGTGVVQWQQQLRGGRAPGSGGFGNGLSNFYGLGPKPGGGVLVFGQFQAQSLYIGSGSTPVQTGQAQQNNFLASFDVNGNLLWSRMPTAGLVTATTADAAGNYYVTGLLPLPGTTLQGIGVVKFNGTGAMQWTRTQTPRGTTFEAGRLIVVDNAGNVTIVANGTLVPGTGTIFGTLPLRAPSNVVRLNAQGQEQWVANDWWPGVSRNYIYVDAVAIGLDAQGNAYYTSEISGDTAHTRPPVQLGAHTLVGAGVIVSRIGSRHNTIAGRLYFDQNSNGVRDAGEGPFPMQLVLEARQPGATALATPDAAGNYRLYAGLGAYTATVPQLPAGYAISQPGTGTYSGSFGSYGNLDSARHVGVRVAVPQTDVRATLTAYGAARPGFTTRYRLTIENVGTTTVPAGTATLTLDARAIYVSSIPAAAVSGRVASWNYAAIAPFGRREFEVMFSLPTNVPAGTVLSTTANAPVTGDATPADNAAAYSHTVTSSYDPNDIEVNYARLTPAQVAARQPLDYTVRFQNMGTDTAFTVVINDTLDFRKLNIASVQLVAQSHNCIWSLSGNGLLTVRFLDIKLPHRNMDVIRSQGFVRFRVQPKTTLAVGEIIPNHAGIVFDYNAPVRTNTATTTVLLASAALASHQAPAWEAYPNPASDAVTVSTTLATGGLLRLELLDALGRTVRQHSIAAPAGAFRQTLDLNGLGHGLYLLRLTPPAGPATTQRLVRN